MCQVYHGAILKNGKSRCKIKKRNRNKLMNRAQRSQSRTQSKSEGNFRQRSSDTENEGIENLSTEESAKRCMKGWNTTTMYHWSVASARRNSKNGVRKTLRNKIAERNMDKKHENAVRYRSEKKKSQNNPTTEPRNTFTATCPPPEGIVLASTEWHNMKQFRYHTSELCPSLQVAGHTTIDMNTVQQMGITECARCERQRTNPAWRCPVISELPLMNADWLQDASLASMRKQCLARGVDAEGRQLVVRSRLRIWLKFQIDNADDTCSTTSEASRIAKIVATTATAACMAATMLYQIGPFGASVSYMPPVAAHTVIIMLVLLVMFAGFGLKIREWLVGCKDEKKVKAKRWLNPQCRKRPNKISEPPPQSVYPVTQKTITGVPTGC